jgi:hypothetical protein
MRPHDPIVERLVRQWLAKVEEDFVVAEHLLAQRVPSFGPIGLLAQQAPERSLKALLSTPPDGV